MSTSPTQTFPFSGLVGTPEQIEEIEKVATTMVPVAIFGETGVGKTVTAYAIHRKSERKGPFVTFNCASVPEEMIDAELFGYAAGAFTGAVNKYAGKFRLADKGTLFLDEVGDMPMYTQAKLLTVLGDGNVVGLGEKGGAHVDVRIISATNKCLEDEIRAKRFREDLYYRLARWRIRMLSLREARKEIRVLAPGVAASVAAMYKVREVEFSKEALRVLEEHNWPGNIRGLEDVIAHVAVKYSEKETTAEQIRLAIKRRARVGTKPAYRHGEEEDPRTFPATPNTYIPPLAVGRGSILPEYEYQEANTVVDALNRFGNMQRAALYCYCTDNHERIKGRMAWYGITKLNDGTYSMDVSRGTKYRDEVDRVVGILNKKETIPATASYLMRSVDEIEKWIEECHIEQRGDGVWTSSATSTTQARGGHE